METHYSVIEIQVNVDGTVGIPPIATYTNRDEAESKYHTILSFAAVSSLARHTAIIVTDDGKLLERKSYEHLIGNSGSIEE